MERTVTPWPIGEVRDVVLRAGPAGGEIEWTVVRDDMRSARPERWVLRLTADWEPESLRRVSPGGAGPNVLA